MHKFRWLKLDNTYILMGLDESYLHPEWHPIAQVTLRQVYETQPPAWHVWLVTRDGCSFLMEDERHAFVEDALAKAWRQFGADSSARP